MSEETEGLKEELGRRDAEIEALRADLQRARERSRELENSRRAMLYMLEDLNESAAEKTRLYEKIKEEAEVSGSLLSMFETLNTGLDERDLIQNVTSLAPRYLKFDRTGVFLYDEEIKGFRFSGGYGFSSLEEGMLLSKILTEKDFPAMEIALRGQMVIIANASEPGFINREIVDAFNIGSAVMVPISIRGKVIGGIYSDYRIARPIEDKEVSLLKGLADGIAIALQNSRLYKESVERLMELSGKIETIKTMAHLGREILSNIDRAEILKTATAIVNRIIPCDRAAVALKEGDICKVVSEWGVGQFSGKVYGVKDCDYESIERSHSSLYLPDVSADTCPYHVDLSAIGIKSVLMVPLIAKGEVIGFLDISSSHHGILSPVHLSNAENIASQITVALENARLYEELQQLLIGTITSLASAIDAKSPWTNGHSARVTRYAVEIGRELELKEHDLERLRLSGLLHDVGKIGTYDIVLDKPGKLTDEEFDLIKKHPRKGEEILGSIKQLSDVIPGVLHHHERYDGRGYPDGLMGEDIPLQARILCVADSFDSMTADRPYRPSPGRGFAVSEFKRCSGTQFDPKVVEAFLRVLERSGV